jgi:hypothetical protein
VTARRLTLAVLGVLLLTLGALALVHRFTEPGPVSAVISEPAPAEEAASRPASVGSDAAPPEPLPGAEPAPGSPVEVRTGPRPPPLPSDPQARADQLLELRRQRRADGMDQLNAREAARRARLGLPPAPAPAARSVPDSENHP